MREACSGLLDCVEVLEEVEAPVVEVQCMLVATGSLRLRNRLWTRPSVFRALHQL